MTASPLILFVEDRAFFDDLEIIKLEGLNYDLAETAAAARDKLQETTYAAVLLDIMLEPGEEGLIPHDVPAYMGGVSVLRMILDDRFHAAGNGKNLAVVVYTAVGLLEVKEVILKLLGTRAQDRYFEKPESFEEISKALKRAIAGRRAG